jgi:uncharacterized Fe-S center protein
MLSAGVEQAICANEFVAIKMHFGESGGTGFIRPVFIRRVVQEIKKLSARPFLTDTNTMYVGSRGHSLSHLETAFRHGFTPFAVDAPVIISGGIRSRTADEVPIKGKYYQSVLIAKEILEADALVAVSHFKGHDLTVFGGALKNLGMGCSVRQGKISMHSSVKPLVDAENCDGCRLCLRWCPVDAISIEKVAEIDAEVCIGCGECFPSCPSRAIGINWDSASGNTQERMVEHVLGVVKHFSKKALFINFLTNISPSCDCWPYTDSPIVPDIGILSSRDPVAIDMASYDLVNQQRGLENSRLRKDVPAGEDKFKVLYPNADGMIQLKYAEELGIGKRKYILEKIK